MIIDSPAFEHHQPIPAKYTCDGEDISPALTLSDIPDGSKSLALIVDDPDAPRGTVVHWVVWNIDPTTKQLKEGYNSPFQGMNEYREQRYKGPCPPRGKPHRYYFKLYALDIQLSLPAGSTKDELEDAMEGHILGKAELIGTYQRS